MNAWLRRNAGPVLLGLALIAAAAVYAPTLGRGLINYDDSLLLRDNYIVQHASWSSLHRIFIDVDLATRTALGSEYLPVRDLSVMLDFGVWGDNFAGFHLTNLLLYLLSIALVYATLDGFGIDRRIAGLAALVWALHPSHAESVAWLSERKGLLGMTFAAACGLGYARFRAGRSTAWLVLAAVCAVCATWSKATAAFSVASLVGLELALPALRSSWRRSLVGLGVIGVVGALAFVPVLMTATSFSVVGTTGHDRVATVFGVHGFYVELAAMAMRNAPTYPIASEGPSALELVIGAVMLVVILGVALIPRRGRWQPPPELRAAAVIWLFGWLPASQLILPIQLVVVADRYALFPSLGVALAVAAGIVRIPRTTVAIALAAVITLAAAVRSLDAQQTWAGPLELWGRAVESSPNDGGAWAFYADALEQAGEADLALAAVDEGLAHVDSSRLVQRKAILLLARHRRDEAIVLFRRAAEAGESIAMSDLALLELDDPAQLADALEWARRGAVAAPASAHAHRSHGKVALAAGKPDEALSAFEYAIALEPTNLGNRYNLGLALVAVHRPDDARAQFEACVNDPSLGPLATARLGELR